jgi:hypothetical protein
MQKIEARRNGNGGVDLVTESNGDTVLVMTGDRQNSLDFWDTMARTAREAMYEMHKDEETEETEEVGEQYER